MYCLTYIWVEIKTFLKHPSLLKNGSTYHAVYNAVYGIKWAHEINGIDDPTKKSFVVSVLEASKRVAPKTTQKKRAYFY
jgi:hypothetical protein